MKRYFLKSKIHNATVTDANVEYEGSLSVDRNLMDEAGISNDGIFRVEQRPTTAKTRVIADNHHIVRIDKENKEDIPEEIEDRIIEFFKENIDELNACILQDYNKGVLTRRLIKELIHICNNNGKIVTVDPKFNNFFEFKGVTVFKPNRKETEDAFGIRIETPDNITKAGNRLLDKLDAEFVLLTLGEAGIALFESDKSERRIPTKARKVADVSGAGDTVISTLTIALAAGADIFEAAYLANYAAGIVCEEVGIAPIELERLFDTVVRDVK